MKKVNIIIMLGVFLTCTSTAKASYEDEMELRTMSKIEAQESGYSLGATKEEIDLMAAIAEAEAGNQGIMGKRLVVDVILNRVDSDYFPDTIEKVIYQQNQFTSINDGNFDKAKSNISDESYAAVYDELLLRTDHDISFTSRPMITVNTGYLHISIKTTFSVNKNNRNYQIAQVS